MDPITAFFIAASVIFIGAAAIAWLGDRVREYPPPPTEDVALLLQGREFSEATERQLDFERAKTTYRMRRNPTRDRKPITRLPFLDQAPDLYVGQDQIVPLEDDPDTISTQPPTTRPQR